MDRLLQESRNDETSFLCIYGIDPCRMLFANTLTCTVAPTSWIVAPERTGAPLKQRSDIWLKIGAVSVVPPFDSKSLVYRLDDQRYQKDFYNVYTVIPSEIISNAERK